MGVIPVPPAIRAMCSLEDEVSKRLIQLFEQQVSHSRSVVEVLLGLEMGLPVQQIIRNVQEGLDRKQEVAS